MRIWEGKVVCDRCDTVCNDVLYDALADIGSWGVFCHVCFVMCCIGLGVGLGQKYELKDDGKWHLVEGGDNDRERLFG